MWNLSRAAPPPEPSRSVAVHPRATRLPSHDNITRALRYGGGLHTQAFRHVHTAGARPNAVEHWIGAHTRAITDINWSHIHPEMLASCSVDMWTWVWDLRAARKPVQGYTAWNASMSQVKFSKGDTHRLAVSCDNKVHIWDARHGAAPLATIEAHRGKIYGVDWSPYAGYELDHMITCSLDGTVKHWNLMSETSLDAIGSRTAITCPERTLEADYPIWRAKHLPFGFGVMTVAHRGDTAPILWARDQLDTPVARFQGHTDNVKEFLFRTRGPEYQLLTWSRDETLRIWPITDRIRDAVDAVSSLGAGESDDVAAGAVAPYSELCKSYRDVSSSPETEPDRPRRKSAAQRVVRAQSASSSTLFNPVAWMACVQLRGETDDSLHSTLRGEVLRVSQRWPLALEAFDVAAHTCTIAAYGPWLDDGSTHAFLRASLKFPTDYPCHGPVVKLERNSNIPYAKRANIQQGLADIVTECENAHEHCLERCVEYLVQSPGNGSVKPRKKENRRAPRAPRPAVGAVFCGDTLVSFAHAGPAGSRTPNSSRFLYSYEVLIDIMHGLPQRTRNVHDALPALDLDMLTNTSVLARTSTCERRPVVTIRSLPNSTFATEPP